MLNSSNFNWQHDAESDNFKLTITEQIVQKIVNEEDEYTMKAIEEYVETEQRKGKLIAARIIPEGKLRHIINLGLSVYNNKDISGIDLFPQEQYIEFLRRELIKEQAENQKLRNRLGFGKVEE